MKSIDLCGKQWRININLICVSTKANFSTGKPFLPWNCFTFGLWLCRLFKTLIFDKYLNITFIKIWCDVLSLMWLNNWICLVSVKFYFNWNELKSKSRFDIRVVFIYVRADISTSFWINLFLCIRIGAAWFVFLPLLSHYLMHHWYAHPSCDKMERHVCHYIKGGYLGILLAYWCFPSV